MKLAQSTEPEFETYNMTDDPLKISNLVFAGDETTPSIDVRPRPQALPREPRTAKRLTEEVAKQTGKKRSRPRVKAPRTSV